MTWSGKFKVQSVSDGPAPIDVLAAASGPEEITSNTEGDIRSMELRIQLDTDETSLKPGDVMLVSGSFTA